MLTIAFLVAVVGPLRAEPPTPEIARMLEGTLTNAEQFRKRLPNVQYEARMRVLEWNGRGQLRGTANAVAIMRPGDAHPVTYLTREMQGKVRLPDDKEERKDEEEKDVTLQEFAREHRIADRFEFDLAGVDQVAGEPADRVSFKPKPNQAEKNSADRFLDAISGTAWVARTNNQLVKFDLHLDRNFPLLWIFAALKELSIQYELIAPGEILGHAKLRVIFALSTPIYSIKQEHAVDLDHWRTRETR